MKNIFKYLLVLFLISFITQVSLGQNFIEPVTINTNNYGPKLILNDQNIANKVPIEFRTNNAIKWELGMRPASGGNDLALWSYNGSYSPILWFKYINGNVGIGTQNPSVKFEVIGDTKIGSNGNFFFHAQNELNFKYNSENTEGWWINYRGTYEKDQFRNLYIGNGKGFSVLTVFGKKNNIGIGLLDPDSKLSIYGPYSDGWNSGIELNREGGGKGWIVVDSDGMKFRTPVDGDGFYFRDNDNNTSLIIKDGGQVGIGTTLTGTHRLAVEGTIGAREIVVETGEWSDFVFNKDYKLKNLEEVENFIEENNHLPDIPSEKEVIENGIQVGEMNAKLLQKIEELTLYMIDINKRVKSLEEENKALKEENNTLKTQ